MSVSKFFKEVTKMTRQSTPYLAHVFVCVNDRHGERKSCGDGGSPLIKDELKRYISDMGWKGKVRVSTSGCMGLCGNGPNLMIYPQEIFFSEVAPDELEMIKTAISEIVEAFYPEHEQEHK